MIYIIANIVGHQTKLLNSKYGYLFFSNKIKKNAIILLNKILLIKNFNKFQVGNPFIENLKFPVKILDKFNKKKITLIKTKPKKGYQKKFGVRKLVTKFKLI